MSGSRLLGVLGVIAVIGLLTSVHAYLMMGYGLEGLRSHPVEPGLLVVSGLPTAFFLGASLLRRRSVAMQVLVTAAATLVGILCIATIWYELSKRFIPSRTGPGTGTLSYMAWLLGVGVAAVILLIAVGATVHEWLCRDRQVRPWE